VFGGGSTPSPFVGLVLINPKPVPDIPSPPMNSLPPLLCPPGLDGTTFAEPGELGDSGGLAIPVPLLGDAAGLKLKLGRGGGGDRPDPFSFSRLNPVAPSCNSYADLGLRLPVALESDDGAEDAVVRAGKTNGGLGVGPELLNVGDGCPTSKS
jgi:hypothetical protein